MASVTSCFRIVSFRQTRRWENVILNIYCHHKATRSVYCGSMQLYIKFNFSFALNDKLELSGARKNWQYGSLHIAYEAPFMSKGTAKNRAGGRRKFSSSDASREKNDWPCQIEVKRLNRRTEYVAMKACKPDGSTSWLYKNHNKTATALTSDKCNLSSYSATHKPP